jgi:hypothetical protein
LLPERRFATFKVNETRAQLIAITHISYNIVEGALTVAGAAIHRAMFATEITFVCDEEDRLQWSATTEKSCTNEPLCEVEIM